MEVKTVGSKEPSYSEYFGEVLKYRSLIISFAARDLKVQFAQSFLGILWSAIQPITGLIIYSLFFGTIIKIDTPGVPYPVFAFAGIVCWYYFSYLVGNAGVALKEQHTLINKVYFPKLILPFAKTLVGIVEFGISFLLLLILMFAMGHYPDIKILLAPVVVLMIVIAGLSIGIWLAALTVRYRDFHHIIPYLVSFGIWVTPVFYPLSILPETMQKIMFLNPMAGVISYFRWVVLDSEMPDIGYLFGFIPMLLLLLGGLVYFKRVDRHIADHL